jgi:hypothetical protein
MFITQYDLKDIYNKDGFYIIHNFIKRNFKVDKYEDVIINNKLKKNIPHYKIDKIIKKFFYNARDNKTGNNNIYKYYLMFIEYFKNEKFNKETNFFISQFPKPKYERKKWKTWKKVSDELIRLKSLKRKILNDKIINKNKLNNIVKDINSLQKRKIELGDLLK